MTKVTLTPIANTLNQATAVNGNLDVIEEAFENTLSRDGTGPNQMEATNNQILIGGSADLAITTNGCVELTYSIFRPGWYVTGYKA